MATVYSFDVVLCGVRNLKQQGKLHCTVQRLGASQGVRRMEAKTSEIDTRVTSAFAPVLFRVLVQDTIYDRIIITAVMRKTFGTEVLGMCVVPSSVVSTMATMPRAATVRQTKQSKTKRRRLALLG